jgi:hypothetical protein
MYADYFLKFPDEATANAVLFTPAPVVEPVDGEPAPEPAPEPQPPTPKYANIDVCGVLYDAADPESETPPVPLEGWHVNVRLIVGAEDPAPLLAFAVLPRNPRCTWAGPMYPAVLPAPGSKDATQEGVV